MDLTSLPTIVTLMIALSVATERVVEIVKGIWPLLNLELANPRAEGRRHAALQVLAVGAGILVAWFAYPITNQIVPAESRVLGSLALGLLASGGSGFWNSILTYAMNLKNLQAAELQGRQAGAAMTAALPQPSEGQLRP